METNKNAMAQQKIARKSNTKCNSHFANFKIMSSKLKQIFQSAYFDSFPYAAFDHLS